MELVQNKSPKVDAKTLKPATFPEDPEQEWCAPALLQSNCFRLNPQKSYLCSLASWRSPEGGKVCHRDCCVLVQVSTRPR